jgi:hypothetical protein
MHLMATLASALLFAGFLALGQAGSCACAVPDASIIVDNGTPTGLFHTYKNGQ